ERPTLALECAVQTLALRVHDAPVANVGRAVDEREDALDGAERAIVAADPDVLKGWSEGRLLDRGGERIARIRAQIEHRLTEAEALGERQGHRAVAWADRDDL